MQIRRVMLSATAALVLCAGVAQAKPMPDAAFEQWTQKVVEKRTKLAEAKAERSEMAALYNKFMDRVTVSDLRPSQIAWLNSNGMLNYSRLDESGRDYTDEAKTVIATFKDKKDAEGAVATALHAEFAITGDSTQEEDAAVVRAALNHPGLESALDSGDISSL